MKDAFIKFGLRWAVSALGLWVAAGLIGSDRITYQNSLWVIVIAGLILAIINMIIKPIVILFSLPAILFSLGLFMIVINAGMVLLASWLYAPLEVADFWVALLAGIVIGIVNYLVTAILDWERS